MQSIQSFPPISRPDAQRLILGSMPGNVSLAALQYYAHPRNAFWKIMGELFGFDYTLDYDIRVQHLLDQKIAVWDVAKQCIRPGSLDSNIVETSVIANDFNNFFQQHPAIRHVCLNGNKAAALYKKHVLPGLAQAKHITWTALPSTSPANAGMSFNQKAEQWKTALKPD